MKGTSAIIFSVVILLFVAEKTFSQAANTNFTTSIIEPYPIKITLNKTTNLIFPFSIKSVDRGSADVLAQKAKGVDNILLVKAGRENFAQTNLSVITNDGKLYSFIVDYMRSPTAINFSFEKDTSIVSALHLSKPLYTEADIQRDAEEVAKQKRTLHGLNDFRYQVELSLIGIYIKNDVAFFQIYLKNSSNINYDIDMLRFSVKDEKRSKRTASQEVDIQPLYKYGDTSFIKGKSRSLVVFALPKFTIPDKKYLSIQLIEQNGGRQLGLHIYSRTILKAEPLK